jgi:biopolymer transport protein ExbD
MGMNVGSADEGDESLNSSINTTPLVDVMLVLLIIFLITIPVVTDTVPVQLPEEVNQATQTKPENITIAVDRDGQVFWNNAAVPDQDSLQQKLYAVAVQLPQPEVHIRGDQESRFEHINQVVEACQRASIVKVAFITEPDRKSVV